MTPDVTKTVLNKIIRSQQKLRNSQQKLRNSQQKLSIFFCKF
jgi:hypothetical protein